MNLPRPSIKFALPESAKGVLGILALVLVLAGPQVWIAADRVAGYGLLGDLPIGSIPDLSGLGFEEFGGGGGGEPPIPSGPVGDLLEGLAVLDDHSVVPAYEREAFMSGWTDRNGSGCTTREDVLLVAFADAEHDGCTVVAGTGSHVSTFDSVTMTDPAEVDIDHVVALEDMWTAGAWEWDDELRATAAQDTANLVAVTASVNRSKGSRGPDEWQPPAGSEATCDYAGTYVRVKAAYELSVTTAQRNALASQLSAC